VFDLPIPSILGLPSISEYMMVLIEKDPISMIVLKFSNLFGSYCFFMKIS